MSMEKIITCISCPVGCRMTVTLEGGEVLSVTGNTCRRGEVYARQECIAPQRMVTAVIPVAGADMPLSVKTRQPIPKEQIAACMAQLAQLHISAPVTMGQTVLENVCGSGVDVIATRSVERKE